ncbi:MAG: MFS transporter [Spirochaetaceae bacterium]|jgi:fucose permease|nr:MFS transporter [Spirochaetaceae bacterium]
MVSVLVLLTIYLSFIGLGLPDSLLGAGWPSMYTGLKVPLHYAGIISMITAGGTVISSLLSERVIRRFGTALVTMTSMSMTAAALIGFSFSGRFLLLCLWAVPLGLGAGSVDTALNNYVALHYRAKHMSWLHCFWGLGASAGPLIMSAYLTHGMAWKFGYRTVGIIQACLAAVLLCSLPLWRTNGASSEVNGTNKHGGLPYRRIFALPGLKQVLGAFFCYCAVETITGLWGATYLVTVRNIAKETAARWIALYYGGITAGRFLSGFLTMVFNNRSMVRLGQIAALCGVAVLTLPFDRTILPGIFMLGLGFAPMYPSLIHETPRNFGNAYSQAIIGLQMASAYIGTTLMPPLFGKAAAVTGFGIFPFFIGGVLMLKIALTETLNRKAGSPSIKNDSCAIQ